MYSLEVASQFKKDLKLAKKRGLKMKLLDLVVSQLLENGKLTSKY